nr:hypothetical protein CFP56_17534 [Quercus suber]
MTSKGPVITSPIQRLVTHKDYAIEMVNLIIKETDLDPWGVFHRLHKHQEIEKKERAQYSEAVHTLNKELTAKTAALAEETCQREEAKMVKTYLATELASLREQMEKAKADAMAEFRVSQPFFDSCGVYFGVEFNDCLKHVQRAKDTDAETVVQPAPSSLETPAVQSATVPSAVDGLSPVDPTASQVPSS